jgi:F-box interacting protein
MDVIFEILSWVPVKSLCRFMCVSKQWRAIIFDPAFIAAHESRAEPLLVSSYRTGTSLCLTDMDGNVVRRMNGVDRRLAFRHNVSCFDKLACFTDGSPSPHVIDLATGDVILSRPKLEERVWSRLGFGRTALSHLYKVVRFQWRQICSVLTIGDGAGWRRMQSPATEFFLGYECTPATIDGVMYFSATVETKILCFDLEKEEWNGEIRGPWIYPDPELRDINISQLNDALCVAQMKLHTSAQAFVDVWLLMDSENIAWSKAYTIKTSPDVHLVKPLRILRDGRKLQFSCAHKFHLQGGSRPMLQVYDPCLDRCTGETVALADAISVCSLRLRRFIAASS